MATATITLDDDQGAVACKLVFSGGFDKTSNAHQHAQIIIGLMDQHMQRMGNAVIDPTIQEQAPALAIPDVEGSRIILGDA